MNSPGEGKGERTANLRMACERFGILPAQPAVDSTGSAVDEADRL